MNGVVLTLNTGSSSVKAAAFEATDGNLNETPLIKGQIAGLDGAPKLTLQKGEQKPKEKTFSDGRVDDHGGAIEFLLDEMRNNIDGEIIAVGHRIVHGGAAFSGPQLLSPGVIEKLEALTPLAPGHQRHNLAGVSAVARCWPEIPQIACFDTTFHRTQPDVATRFALPRALAADEGVIRYGFHGLSYEYVASAAPSVIGGAASRMIVAHLGSGASMCAMLDGKSVATTMGFTALDGLPMATRCGDIDPGVLLYLLQEKNMTAAELSNMLHYRSGLLGLSGVSGDMRILEQSDDNAAREAIDYFVYRCRLEVGALAAALGGVDALIFTAGIGENSTTIRKRIIEGAAWLGFQIDDAANEAQGPRITQKETAPSAWVIPTNEELVIARRTLALARPGGGA